MRDSLLTAPSFTFRAVVLWHAKPMCVLIAAATLAKCFCHCRHRLQFHRNQSPLRSD